MARRSTDTFLAPVLGSVRRTRSPTGVCLTFDDGPDERVTPELLDVLSAHGASSTFFVLLNQCRAYPSQLSALVADGHEVALHGVDHRRITSMTGSDAERYLADARAELEDLVHRKVELYRPPYGSQTIESFRAARRAGLQVVVWSDDAEDWVDRPATVVADNGLRALTPGGILLLHERLEPDLPRDAPVTSFDRCDMVRTVLRGCAERGLVPTTVGTALSDHGPRRTAWFRP